MNDTIECDTEMRLGTITTAVSQYNTHLCLESMLIHIQNLFFILISYFFYTLQVPSNLRPAQHMTTCTYDRMSGSGTGRPNA